MTYDDGKEYKGTSRDLCHAIYTKYNSFFCFFPYIGGD